jgi:hypothetical protein
LTEWVLVPLALFFNWREGGRRMLAFAAAALYYAERLATYLYFGPLIFSWQQGLVQRSPKVLEQVALWLTLDWIREAANVATILLFVLVTFRPAPGRQPSEKPLTSHVATQPSR